MPTQIFYIAEWIKNRSGAGKESKEEKGQHLCNQALSGSKTDLLRSCGCGWDSWEGDCPNTNGLWTREEEEGGWAACSNTEVEGAAERKGPDWMEFSMALNRSPVNMETEDGGKTKAYAMIWGFQKGEDHSEVFFIISYFGLHWQLNRWEL